MDGALTAPCGPSLHTCNSQGQRKENKQNQGVFPAGKWKKSRERSQMHKGGLGTQKNSGSIGTGKVLAAILLMALQAFSTYS